MEFLIVSGRSGSGKSATLHILEDMGYYCVDNLPLTLLSSLCQHFCQESQRGNLTRIAVSIDARNLSSASTDLGPLLKQLDQIGIKPKFIFLDASDHSLFKRFSETRRKHPLTHTSRSLAEALDEETKLLAPIASMSTIIDTTQMSIHQLREVLNNQLNGSQPNKMSILMMSFGFKRGIPVEADFVFDIRCLPNPYWEKELRLLSGLEEPVQSFLEKQDEFGRMFEDIKHFLNQWLNTFQKNNRNYMTVAIGCTGGHHRSVFMAEKLCKTFKEKFGTIQVRHRDLKGLS